MLALLAQISSDDGNAFETLNIGSSIFSLVLLAIGVGACIWVIVDANRRPGWVWASAGQQKGLWIGLAIGGIILSCCCGVIGIIVAGLYAGLVRSKLEAAERNRGGGFGGPPGGYPGGSGGPPGGFGGPGGGFGGPPGGAPGGPPGGFPPGGSGGGSPGWGPPPPPSSPPPVPGGGDWGTPPR